MPLGATSRRWRGPRRARVRRLSADRFFPGRFRPALRSRWWTVSGQVREAWRSGRATSHV